MSNNYDTPDKFEPLDSFKGKTVKHVVCRVDRLIIELTDGTKLDVVDNGPYLNFNIVSAPIIPE